jgi:hypothetical protein
MNPLFWCIWLNALMAATLQAEPRRPQLRVIEGGRKGGAPRALKRGRRISLAYCVDAHSPE